jgi:hypothetical protein
MSAGSGFITGYLNLTENEGPDADVVALSTAITASTPG